MRNSILATAAIFTGLITSAAAQSIGGEYRVSGKNFDGSRYSGTAQIVFQNNQSCRISWITGSTTSQGTCMRRGRTFAAGYTLEGIVGLVVYVLQPDGSLDGVWTMANKPGSGTEVLTPKR